MVEQVGMEGDHYRTRAPRACDLNCPPDELRHLAGTVGTHGQLGDRPIEGRKINFLEGATVSKRTFDVADEDNHRSRVFACRLDADTQISRSWASGCHDNGRYAGQSRVRISHESRARLMSRRNQLERWAPAHRIQQRQETLTWHRVATPDTTVH